MRKQTRLASGLVLLAETVGTAHPSPNPKGMPFTAIEILVSELSGFWELGDAL